MIPISLTLQGVYSYKKKQTIDFSRLTKAGLFGIFGATGTGKSAIIESISYALYGETERINKVENRYYNMMNLQSNELLIDFECMSESNNTFYRFVVKGKRSKKQFENVYKYDHSYYKKSDSAWVPIPAIDVKNEITGLSYEHFKRTVIIPQGKFMEFLHLKPVERTKMLKEIFNLHAFDLSDKTKSLYSSTKEQHALLQGQLQGIGEVSIEAFEQKQKEIAELKKTTSHLQSSVQKLQSEIDSLTRLADDVAELQKTKKILEELLLKAPYFNELAVRIANIQYVRKNFEELFRRHSQKNAELERITKLIESKTQEHSIQKTEFETAEKTYILTKKHYDALPEFEQETKALEQLMHIRVKTNQLAEIELRKNNGTATITATEHEITVLEKKHAELLKLRESETVKQGDIQYLTQQKIELEQYQSYVKQIDEIRKERVDYDTNIQIYATKILALFIELGITTDSYQYDYEPYCSSLLTDMLAQKKEHEIAIQMSKTHEEIAFLHSNLKPGVPCPLCGSKEHPEAHIPRNGDHSVHEHESALESLEQRISHIQSVLQKITLLQQQISQIKQLDSKASHKMHELTIARNLAEPDEKQDVIEAKIAQYSKSKLEIERIDKEMRTILEQKQIKDKDLHTYKDAINKLSEKLSGIRSEIAIHTSQCNQAIQDKYAKYNYHEISTLLEQRAAQCENYKTAFVQAQLVFETAQKRVHETLASLETLTTQHNAIIAEIKVIENETDDKLKDSSFKTREEISVLLNQTEQLVEITKELEHYKFSTQTAQETIVRLSNKLAGSTFHEQDFIQKKQDFAVLETEFRTKNEIYIQQKQLLEQYAQRIEKQKDILTQLQNTSRRLENLNTLSKLFVGQGFVNYMSTRYLHLLCEIANVRFGTLTKHALQLEIDDDNTFKIRDFLNNGQVRHIKTLSGGQAFQAALSLALALSETIQTETPIASNFFFIDEGFGSQDKEALQIVFETLRNLQQEGKIVGIISHVEELKEHIPIHVSVKQTEEGSFIQV